MARRPKSIRASREEQLWEEWVNNGKNPNQLRPLLQSLEPLIQQTVTKYRAADVSPQALRVQAENQLIQGLETYNPSKGSLSTHLNWQMRGVGRFVEKHQNFARIPGSRIRHVGKFQQAQAQLRTELGRAPTLEEVARRAKIPQTQATKLQQELRSVHFMEMQTDVFGKPMDFGAQTISADRERIELIYHDLTPMEQQVVDYTLGRGGKPTITSNKELARRLGVTDARISNVRASIAQKAQRLSWIR